MKSLINSSIQKMKAYTPPLDGRRNYAGTLCDFNERTIPVSAVVRAAVSKFAKQNKLQLYPEYGDVLVNKIAAYAGVSPSQIMITNGSDQGIDLIFRTVTREGDTVVIPSPSFAMFYQCAGILGNKMIAPTYRLPNLAYPMTEVIQAIETGAKLVVICNPNNPTGTLLSLDEIEAIVKRAVKKLCMVYVDEAYYEFPGVTAVPIIKKYPNLIITRTFSKAFGLAALRIGYVISQAQTIAQLQKIRGPYDVNMAGVAGALAALKNVKETRRYAQEVMKKAKPLVENFFRKQKIPFYPSGSNFILFKPKNPSAVYEMLKKNGILVRPRSGQNIDGTLRVTIGTVSQMKKFIAIYQNKILQKVAFLDRDGALIFEPQDTFQIDYVSKLRILPGVIPCLKKLMRKEYRLVMVSNQDGRGTASFPEKNFTGPQNRMLQIFRKNGIRFSEIFVCPHFKKEDCLCRKPKTGLVDAWMVTNSIDMENSFMYGDRETDRIFAKNLWVKFRKAKTNGPCTITI